MDRAALEQIPAGTDVLRRIRYSRPADLADITDDELAAAARWLRAASIDASAGAVHIERIRTQRRNEDNDEAPALRRPDV